MGLKENRHLRHSWPEGDCRITLPPFVAVLFSPTIQAVTVVRADPVEMLVAGDFSDIDQWALNAERNDTEPAPYTSISINSDSMIIEHDRPENTAETRSGHPPHQLILLLQPDNQTAELLSQMDQISVLMDSILEQRPTTFC